MASPRQFAVVSIPVLAVLGWLAVTLMERGVQTAALARLSFSGELRALEYWTGVLEAGGMPRPRPLRVLAYHAIKDLVRSPGRRTLRSAAQFVSPPVGCPPTGLFGFEFVSGDEFLYFFVEAAAVFRCALCC